MDTGVDVRQLRQGCLSAVCVKLAERSAVKSVEVYSVGDEWPACVGRDARPRIVEREFTFLSVPAREFIVRFQADLKDVVISQPRSSSGF